MSRNFYSRKTNIFSAVLVTLLVIALLIFLGVTFKDEIGNLFNKFKDNTNEIIDNIKDNNKGEDNSENENSEDNDSSETETSGTEITPMSINLGDYVVQISYQTI